jgi:hypothetical protein
MVRFGYGPFWLWDETTGSGGVEWGLADSKLKWSLGNSAKLQWSLSCRRNSYFSNPSSTGVPNFTLSNNMGLSYFRYSWAQWYPLEIEIHPYSYVQI